MLTAFSDAVNACQSVLARADYFVIMVRSTPLTSVRKDAQSKISGDVRRSPPAVRRPARAQARLAEGPRPGSENYLRLKGIMQDLKLNTVCEDARCPNIGECWHHGTATFMILGDVCTRACAYCAVAHGKPNELDTAEPARVAEAVARMGLQYAVITSVDRDDLADGGAFIFAETIRLTRERVPWLPDRSADPGFPGHRVVAADGARRRRPTCSITTSRRCRGSIAWRARAAAIRDRWSCSIARARYRPDIATKTGIMVGTRRRARRDPRRVRRPAARGRLDSHHRSIPAAVARRTRRWRATTIPTNSPTLKQASRSISGFVHVESGPLVRSSYHAHEQADAFEAHRGAEA